MSTLITSLADQDFSIRVEYHNDRTFAEHEVGDWYLSYMTHYSKDVLGMHEATREQPEEYEVVFSVDRISDLVVCYKGRELEIGQSNREKLEQFITSKTEMR